MVRTLDGTVFSRVLRAGALAVVREQEALDRMNVFPVRDADTGANLAATLRAACLDHDPHVARAAGKALNNLGVPKG